MPRRPRLYAHATIIPRYPPITTSHPTSTHTYTCAGWGLRGATAGEMCVESRAANGSDIALLNSGHSCVIAQSAAIVCMGQP